jgi:hypothetical protein
MVKSRVTDFISYGPALYRGIAAEFNRVNDQKNIVLNSVVATDNLPSEAIEDYQKKYGIADIPLDTDEVKIAKIMQRASWNGNGGYDWLQEQIQLAGFDLYVIPNERTQSDASQFGDFQFGGVQFGAAFLYQDPADIAGELVTSSPTGNIGNQTFQFGSYQFSGSIQFGSLQEGFAVPRPNTHKIPSSPERWGYFFFISPFADRLATDVELYAMTDSEMSYLKKLIIQIKFMRNWCILQATDATLQNKITTDSLYKTTSDGLMTVVSSDISQLVRYKTLSDGRIKTLSDGRVKKIFEE